MRTMQRQHYIDNMKSSLRTVASLILPGLVIAPIGALTIHSTSASASAGRYGLLVGNVRPCNAERFDEEQNEPLIIVLTISNRTYETYNVSADSGTTSYHFDVPAGRYTLSTTWWGSREHSVQVRFDKTVRVNFTVSCGAFST